MYIFFLMESTIIPIAPVNREELSSVTGIRKMIEIMLAIVGVSKYSTFEDILIISSNCELSRYFNLFWNGLPINVSN